MGMNCSRDVNKHLPECKARPKPLMPYFGGKQRVADKIISKFPDHKTYVEPFVGGGSIYWKNTIPDNFVINDLNKDVYNLYKQAKEQPNAVASCDLINVGKEGFKNIKNKPNKNACDVMNLHKNSFGGIGSAYADKGRDRFNNAMSQESANKLRKTKVTNQDFATVMKQHDSPNTLHYLDPPYVKEGGAYATHGVTAEKVCGVAKQMKGKVVISYDDHPEVRKACAGLKFSKLPIQYSASNNKDIKDELVITNY